MTTTEMVLIEVKSERVRQEILKRQGKFKHTCADADFSDGDKLACLGEEFGEVAKSLLHDHDVVSDGGGNLRTELLHVAAIAVAWMESL